ncbi:MAG: ABC transporter substrate-binding protein [Lachnospirales bacterium]
MKKNLFVIAVFIGLPIVLAACTDSGNSTEETNDTLVNSDNPATIGMMSSIENLPFLYMEENKIDEEFGINLELETFSSAKDRDIAYLADEIDFIIGDLIGMATYYKSEKPAIVTGTYASNMGLVVGENSGIETLSDLEGRSILYSKNTVIDYTIDMLLEEVGLSPDLVTKEAVPAMPLRLEMLLKGEADSALMPDPFFTMAEAGGAKNIANSSDYGINVLAFGVEKEFLAENQDITDAFLLAYDKSVEELNAMSDDDFLNYVFEKFEYDESIRDTLTRTIHIPLTLPSEEQFYSAFNWSKEHELIDTDVTYEEATYTME